MWVLNPSVWRGCIYSGKGFWQFQSGEQLDERWAVALREENGSYLSTWVSAQLRIKRWGRTDTDVVSLILSAWHTSSWLLRSAPSFLQGVFLPPHAPDTLPGATNDENLPLIGLGMWSKVGQYVPKTFWIRPPGEKKKKKAVPPWHKDRRCESWHMDRNQDEGQSPVPCLFPIPSCPWGQLHSASPSCGYRNQQIPLIAWIDYGNSAICDYTTYNILPTI